MYQFLLVYDEAGGFVGYVIKDPAVPKLQSTNVYSEGEEAQLKQRLYELNDKEDVSRHWPHPQDPDVLKLLDNPEFHPIEYAEAPVVDEDNSYLVYKKIAGPDSGAEPEWIDSDEVDPEASVIVYKAARVPKRPTDTVLRIREACLQVARERARLSR